MTLSIIEYNSHQCYCSYLALSLQLLLRSLLLRISTILTSCPAESWELGAGSCKLEAGSDRSCCLSCRTSRRACPCQSSRRPARCAPVADLHVVPPVVIVLVAASASPSCFASASVDTRPPSRSSASEGAIAVLAHFSDWSSLQTLSRNKLRVHTRRFIFLPRIKDHYKTNPGQIPTNLIQQSNAEIM